VPPADPAPEEDPQPTEQHARPRPSDPGPAPQSPSATPTARQSVPSTPEPRPTPTRKPPPAPEQVRGPSGALAFGQTYAWDNGLAVTVGRPAELESPKKQAESGSETPPPSSGDAPADGAAAEESGPSDEAGPATATPTPAPTGAPADVGAVVAVDLVLVNGTDRPMNTSIFVAMVSGGVDAEQVNDTAAGLTGPPGTIIQPGQEVSFTMGFQVQDPADLTMEVRPAYHYTSALFVHRAAAQG
jgi:hypothetical protein